MYMGLNLAPRERSVLELLGLQGDLVSDTLTELSKSLLEGRSRLPRLRDLERAGDEVAAEIRELARRTFPTSLGHEDVVALASALDDIIGLAGEAESRLERSRPGVVAEPAMTMGEYLAEAGTQLAAALEHLDGFEGLSERHAEIHRLASEGDRVAREALGDDARRELHDLLGRTLAECAHVADLLATIAVRNA